MQGDQPEHYQVWPRNIAVVRVFQALATQWRAAPMGGVTGLDYSAITPTVLRGLQVSRQAWPEIFAGLQVMEAAALAAFSEAGGPRSTRARRRDPVAAE
jgi:hypothetical protein